MRICHVIEAAGGGSAQVVMDLVRYGVMAGDHVTVIYAPLRAWPRFIAALKALPQVRMIALPMRREVGLHDLADAWRLYRTLKQAGPFDILHGHSSKAGALTRLAGLLFPHTVTIYTPHGFISMSPQASRFYRLAERILSFLGDRIVTVSQAERRHALQLGIAAKKLALIPNGIAPPQILPRHQARQALGLPDDACILGFIGRLAEQKNPLLALRAFLTIAAGYPHTHFCMIGDGPLAAALEDERSNHACAARVHLAGPRDGGNVIAAFDALVCSSDYEGMPIIFLEALFAGVPIISTAVGGIDEAIRDGETGFVASTHTSASLAKALTAFLELPPQRQNAMRQAAQTHAAPFTLDHMGRNTRTLYRDRLAARPSSPCNSGDKRHLRICHIVEATAGGSARIVAQLIKDSLAHGDMVTLIYSPQRADRNFLSAIAAMPELRRIELPMQRRISPRDLYDGVKLYRLLAQYGPFDLVHSHSSKAGALARLAGLFLPKTAKIHTPHGFFALTPRARPVYGWIEWLLSWLTDAIIMVSQREMRLAQEQMHIPQRKLKIIHNGVALDYPVDRIMARQRMGYGDGAYVIGFVGRLVAIKNPQRLVESFIRIARQNPQARLAIVGQGPLKADIDVMLEKNHLTNCVYYINDIDARDVMAGFDCLLCTSDMESFGLVLIEALNAGVPVVTTPVGISDLAVIDGKTGFIADFTPQSLADKVLKLAAIGPVEKAQMAAACRLQTRRFDVKTMTERTRVLYHEVVKRRKMRT